MAIVDPPYGIDDKLQFHDTGTTKNKMYGKKRWDTAIPLKEYFDELMRVSKNQIIWGGNYMTEHLKPSRGWVYWQKFSHNNTKYSHGELAWTSFDKKLNHIKITVDGISRIDDVIHPTQKPVKLYDWLLLNYAKPNDLILDTHLGSGSSRIAAYKGGFNFVGFEIDQEYYEKQEKRFNDFKSQLRLF
ncbi:DNA methyltransferase [Flavobacterium croceum]|uniref:DNA methyltransferase n=1 Tax=Flavobacterium croceum TaxID=370975 RepID=UPI001B7FFDAE|nr:DNA methyltransferase [Flavobacterium croceum]